MRKLQSSRFDPAGSLDSRAGEPRLAPLWANFLAAIIRRMPRGRYRLTHWIGRGLELTFVARMPKELGGCQFYCVLRDEISREVFFSGCYDPQQIACLRDILRPGMTFVDVGANWGLFTLMAAQLVGKEGRVAAIEADPRVFWKLKSNVERNQLENTELFDVAVADREDQMILAGYDELSDNHGVSRLVDKDSNATTKFSVRCRPLDRLLDESAMSTVDLLKIDVEGAEDLVLAGMDSGLRQHRYRCILLELHPAQLAERGRRASDIINAMLDYGYKGWTLDYSPSTMRKAYYSRTLHFSEFLGALDRTVIEQHRHTIWKLPDGVNFIQP